jgi:ABC-type branched-subunit amino acid transport system ATPase component
MLARVGLDGRAGEAVGSLPAVERALVGLLAVLVVPPRVVLLDAPPLEAMSSRARGGVDSLVDDVRRVGTALLVSGVMPLPGADHVLRLSEGEVVA